MDEDTLGRGWIVNTDDDKNIVDDPVNSGLMVIPAINLLWRGVGLLLALLLRNLEMKKYDQYSIEIYIIQSQNIFNCYIYSN